MPLSGVLNRAGISGGPCELDCPVNGKINLIQQVNGQDVALGATLESVKFTANRRFPDMGR